MNSQNSEEFFCFIFQLQSLLKLTKGFNVFAQNVHTVLNMPWILDSYELLLKVVFFISSVASRG